MENKESNIIDVESTTQETIVVNENTTIVPEQQTQVSKYNFEKVDLDNPSSILTYGKSVQDQIVAILKSTAQMSVNQEETFLDDSMLTKITSFDEALEEAEKEAAKKEGVITRIAKTVFKGPKAVKKEDELKTYKGRYLDYVENLKKIVENVEILKQNCLNDIELRKTIAVQMTPYIEELEAMIESGKAEKAAYDQQTSEIAKKDTTMDGQFLVQRRSRISDIFAEKLAKLEKALILYKSQLQEYAIQQSNDMISVIAADSYINDQAPLLEAQGSTQVFNKIQGERIAKLQILNDASNIAIQNNARNLEANTEAAVDLMINGGFSTESLLAVQTALQNGITIIENGKVELKVKVQKDQQVLDQINQLLNENQERIISMIDETAGAITQINNNSTSHVKKLTPPRLNGKK